MTERIEKAIQPDGSLDIRGIEDDSAIPCEYKLLFWSVDQEADRASLHGDFTADELRAVADHMDKPASALATASRGRARSIYHPAQSQR